MSALIQKTLNLTRVYASGLIIRDLAMINSNFRSEQTLSEYLKANRIVAIANIDTKKTHRALKRAWLAGRAALLPNLMTIKKHMQKLKLFPGLSGMDLAKVVSSREA
jgi:carbamoyl-phosphate synthase small subunit